MDQELTQKTLQILGNTHGHMTLSQKSRKYDRDMAADKKLIRKASTIETRHGI
jgi:hypothetical protein